MKYALSTLLLALPSAAFAQDRIFVASSGPGASDRWWTVDAAAGSILEFGESTVVGNAFGALFHPISGELLFTSATERAVRATAVDPSPFSGPLLFDTPVSGNQAYGLEYDESNRLLYCFGTFSSESLVHVFDGDPLSLIHI